MKLKEIMTRDVECIGPDHSIIEAAELMARKDIGLIAVCDGHNGGGVLTDRDIVVRCLAEHLDPQKTTVGECMSTPMCTLPLDADAGDAARAMSSNKVRRVLVEDKQGNLCGVVSLGDLATGTHDPQLCAGVLEGVSESSQIRYQLS